MRDNDIKNEEGSALIIALGMVVLVSLLAISIVTVSQMTDKLSKTVTDRARAAYLAEDSLEMMIWLLNSDIRKHPNRSLGAASEDDDGPRVMCDACEHTRKLPSDWRSSVVITDAVSGYSISGSNPTAYLRGREREFEEDEALLEEYKLCLNRLRDYVDTNDFTQLTGGMEREGYDALGLAPLPRNKPLEYRDEILWIPGFSRFLSLDSYGSLSNIRIIAPQGMRPLRGKPNFFTADESQLSSMTRMDENQVGIVMNARDAWRKNPGASAFSEGLSTNVLSSLRRNYSFRESGCYTFFIKILGERGNVLRVLSCTLRVNRNLSNGKSIQYYDWMLVL